MSCVAHWWVAGSPLCCGIDDCCDSQVSAQVYEKLPDAVKVTAELCERWLQWSEKYPRLTCTAAMRYVCEQVPTCCLCGSHAKAAKAASVNQADPKVGALQAYISVLAKCILGDLLEFGGEDIRLSELNRISCDSSLQDAAASAETELASRQPGRNLTFEAQGAILARCQQMFDETLYTHTIAHDSRAVACWRRVRPCVQSTESNPAIKELLASAVAADFPGEITICPIADQYEIHLKVESPNGQVLNFAIPQDFPLSPPQLLPDANDLAYRWDEFGLSFRFADHSSQYESMWLNADWLNLNEKLNDVNGKTAGSQYSVIETNINSKLSKEAWTAGGGDPADFDAFDKHGTGHVDTGDLAAFIVARAKQDESALVGIMASLRLAPVTEFTSDDHQKVVEKCIQLAYSKRFGQSVNRRIELLRCWTSRLCEGSKVAASALCDQSDLCQSSNCWPLGLFVDKLVAIIDRGPALNFAQWKSDIPEASTPLSVSLVLDEDDWNLIDVESETELLSHHSLPRWCQQVIAEHAIHSPGAIYIEVVLLSAGLCSMFREERSKTVLHGFSDGKNQIFPWDTDAQNGSKATKCWFDKNEIKLMHQNSPSLKESPRELHKSAKAVLFNQVQKIIEDHGVGLKNPSLKPLSPPDLIDKFLEQPDQNKGQRLQEQLQERAQILSNAASTEAWVLDRAASQWQSLVPFVTSVGLTGLASWLEQVKKRIGMAHFHDEDVEQELDTNIEILMNYFKQVFVGEEVCVPDEIKNCASKLQNLVAQYCSDPETVDLSGRWVRFFPTALPDSGTEIKSWKDSQMVIRRFARGLWQSDQAGLLDYFKHVENCGGAYHKGEDHSQRWSM